MACDIYDDGKTIVYDKEPDEARETENTENKASTTCGWCGGGKHHYSDCVMRSDTEQPRVTEARGTEAPNASPGVEKQAMDRGHVSMGNQYKHSRGGGDNCSCHDDWIKTHGVETDEIRNLRFAYAEECKKFQAETKRTSELSKALFEMSKIFMFSEGKHFTGEYAGKKCARCAILRGAMLALWDTVYCEQLRYEEEHYREDA